MTRQYASHPNQVAYINAKLAAIRSALAQGLNMAESNFIKVPVAFSMDTLAARTYLPNMINMIVVKPQTGSSHLVVPHPGFIPFGQNLYEKLLNAGFAGRLDFVDTTALHMAQGEAHCASNVRREIP